MIVTEKPDAAQRIALALDEKEMPRRLSDNGVPYYLVKRDREIIVVPALGHLYTIVGETKGRNYYPDFSFKWVPRYVAERKATAIRHRLQTITRLAKDADIFIDACDYDVEGCIIGYCVLKYACCGAEQTARRMKFSTLTKQELQKAYSELLPHLDFGLIEAGRTRHEVDWLYGINLSRALTIAGRNWSGKYTTLSTGRVQGPSLKFLVEREEAIRSFVPTPYWQIKGQVEIDGQVFEAKYIRDRIEKKKDAETVTDSCRDKKGRVEKMDATRFQQPPPFPFDLGTLQNEAYNLFRYTPRRTLNIAQQLYLKALVSYPRTDSQKLPPAIDYKAILKNLSNAEIHSKLAQELLVQKILRPNEGKKEDPAHPAIHPTGNLPKRTLEASEKRIWDLVVRRFMAVFGKPAVKQNMRVYIKVGEHLFSLSGRRILEEGWMHYYEPFLRFEEVLLPPMKEGQPVNIKRTVLENMFTEPPPRYNPSSLLKKMEEAQIGTKATRADIIQTLYDRGYLEGERMKVTTLGFEVFEVLEKHCPAVVSTALTRELETKMNDIQKDKEKREDVLVEVVELLKPVLQKLKEEEKSIGEQLSNAIEKAKLEERTIGICPTCKTGKLIINHSRKTGKRFVGCTNYFKGLCKTSFPLPQRGTVRSTGRECPRCSWPTAEVRMKGRPWILCFNTECPSRKASERI